MLAGKVDVGVSISPGPTRNTRTTLTAFNTGG